ncbi:MAG: molecular chaperone TorD family protein [Burkholderiales bacterium]|nr:molecular chaperone TorD family protein [Burkholderiales bacterium]
MNAPVTGEAGSHRALRAGAQEEQARADFYALLARLFYAGPDAALLDALARADELVPEGPRRFARRGLERARGGFGGRRCASHPPRVRHDPGRHRQVAGHPYASYYLVATGREKLLAGLRDELDAMGFARTAGAGEPEDHFAGLCDVMRLLIVESGRGEEALLDQRLFFDRYLRGSYRALCAAVEACDAANYYRAVARFAKAFLDVEVESFEML